MFKAFSRIWLVPIVLAAVVAIYFIPPVHDHLEWRVDDVRSQIKYYFNPPEQAVFLPTQQAAIDAIVSATMQAHALAQTASATPQAPSTSTGPSVTPAAT